jgi:hypothetical protein
MKIQTCKKRDDDKPLLSKSQKNTRKGEACGAGKYMNKNA